MSNYTPTTEQVRETYAALCKTNAAAAEFDRWHADEIRKAKAEGARTERERLASLAESAHQAHDIAESAAYVEGETGRQSCIDQWVEICEEPDVWLRNLADDSEWLNACLFDAWEEGYGAGCEDMENGGNATRNPYAEES